MAACSGHPPLAFSHRDQIAIANANEFARRPQAEKCRPALGSHYLLGIIVGSAVALHEGSEMLVGPLLALVPHLPRVEPFGQWQAHRAFHLLHEITGKAEMIEMRVREDEVLQRAAAEQP